MERGGGEDTGEGLGGGRAGSEWGGGEDNGEDWIGAGLGREKASATMFSRPGTCTMELVNSAM